MVQAGDASAVPTRVFGSEDDDFTISEYVYDMNAMGPLTKGQEMVTNNTKPGQPINQNGESFGVLGYFDVEDPVTQPKNPDPIQKGLDFVGTSLRGDTNWDWSGAQQYITTFGANGIASSAMESVTAPCWRVNTTDKIWSIYPVTAEGRKPTTSSTGAYSDFADVIDVTDPSSFEFSYTVPTDFKDQKDLLFAYNVESKVGDTYWARVNPYDTEEYTWKEGANDKFDVNFYHALAAIRLELADNGIADDVYIKQVTISGVYGDGNCTVSGNEGAPVTFVWDCDGYTKTNFTETYNNDKINPAAVLTESSKSFRSKYSSAGGSGELFMIPQTLSGAKMIVKFSKKGIVVTKEIVLDDVTWEAGKYYTYKIKATIHVPGEYLLTNVKFNISDFKNPRTAYMFQEKAEYGSPIEILGIKTIGVVFTSHQFRDPSNKTTSANFYVSNGKNSSPQINSKGDAVEFDFTPVPTSEVCPYVSNEPTHSTENYSGNLEVYRATPPTAYVFDVEGYDKFDFTLDVASSSNSASWTGTISKVIVLEVEGIVKNPDGTYEYEYDYEAPIQ